MINAFKKIIVGGSIALAILSPTILATEKIQNTNITPLNETELKLEEKVETNDILQNVEVKLSGENTSYDFNKEEFYTLYTSSYYSESYKNSIKKYADLQFTINFNITDDRGLTIESIEDGSYKLIDSDTGEPGDTINIYEGNMKFKYIPTQVADEGDAAILEYLFRDSQSYYFDNYDNDYFNQNYDGQTGVSFALTGLSSDQKMLQPIIFHLTWNDSYNNDAKVSSNSIYYDDLKNDSAEIYYKTKKADHTKTWGSSTKFAYIDDWAFYGNFNGQDIETNNNKKYYLKTYGYSREDFLLNSISNTVNLQNFDFSKEGADARVEKTYESWADSYYFDIEYPTFYNLVNVEDLIGISEIESIKAEVESTGKSILDDYFENALLIREDAYNKKFFKYNSDFEIENGIYDFVNYDDEIYLIESIKISRFGSTTSTEGVSTPSKISNMFAGAEEFSAFMSSNGIFEEIINTAKIILYSSSYEYVEDETSSSSSHSYYYHLVMDFELDDKAGFMSSPQVALIVFAILSILGLGVVLFFLVKSSAKENEGIEVVMNNDESTTEKSKDTKQKEVVEANEKVAEKSTSKPAAKTTAAKKPAVKKSVSKKDGDDK